MRYAESMGNASSGLLVERIAVFSRSENRAFHGIKLRQAVQDGNNSNNKLLRLPVVSLVLLLLLLLPFV